jgi:hypothetical protein
MLLVPVCRGAGKGRGRGRAPLHRSMLLVPVCRGAGKGRGRGRAGQDMAAQCAQGTAGHRAEQGGGQGRVWWPGQSSLEAEQGRVCRAASARVRPPRNRLPVQLCSCTRYRTGDFPIKTTQISDALRKTSENARLLRYIACEKLTRATVPVEQEA